MTSILQVLLIPTSSVDFEPCCVHTERTVDSRLQPPLSRSAGQLCVKAAGRWPQTPDPSSETRDPREPTVSTSEADPQARCPRPGTQPSLIKKKPATAADFEKTSRFVSARLRSLLSCSLAPFSCLACTESLALCLARAVALAFRLWQIVLKIGGSTIGRALLLFILETRSR